MGTGMQEHAISTGQTINAKAVARYALLPGILPRLGRMARHFSQLMFIFTQLFGTIGLIDRHHPCLKPENIGVYRFSDILALAVSNLKFGRQYVPQLVMFSAIILSILLVIAVCGLFLVNVLMSAGVAHAQFFGEPSGFGYSAQDDWALQFLGRIFGGDHFVNGPGGNMWFTALLTGMLKHYSMAMLIIAAFMVLYLMLMTLTEAARTGKPFGTRFDSIWAPIRMAMAIGLLIPITASGYNGAQLLVFQSAKWGSNLASNAWFSGLQNMNQGSKFFSAAMADPGYRFVRDMFLVNLCIQTVNAQNKINRQSEGVGEVKYYTTVDDEFITISFGPSVAPDFCGEVKIMKVPVSSPAGLSSNAWPQYTVNQFQKAAIQYLPIPLTAFTNGEGIAQLPPMTSMGNLTRDIAARMAPESNDKTFIEHIQEMQGQYSGGLIMSWITGPNGYWSYLGRTSNGSGFFTTGEFPAKLSEYNTWMMNQLSQDAKFGWTTAGVFYLRMSSVMANISKVVNNPPRVTILPSNLVKVYASADNARADTEKIRNRCSGWWGRNLWYRKFCKKAELSSRVNDVLVGGTDWFLREPKKNPSDYSTLGTDAYDRALEITDRQSPINPDLGILSPIFTKLYEMVEISPTDLHPLGSVINWGFTMLQVSGIGIAMGLLIPGTLGSIGMTLGTVFLVPGFILAFWVPMQPFLYFTFAVIEWMISVLEAVIGMPLWALSLISLEGDGLGRGLNGVKMVFEIILRPTIIIMSLLAAVIVFTAAIAFFNNSLTLYSQGYSDATAESNSFFSQAGAAIGMIFVYMFAVYSLATSCFKLIDAIPDSFGRWGGLPAGFGSGIKTGMNDITKAVIGGLMLKNVTGAALQGRKNMVAADKKDAESLLGQSNQSSASKFFKMRW